MFVWYDTTTRAVKWISQVSFTVAPPTGQAIVEIQVADGPMPGPVEQLRLTADLSALEVDPARVPAPAPDGPGFTMAMITALGNDPVAEIDVAQAYPPFFEYIRFANWVRVQWCITDALSKAKITQVQYDAIKAAAAAHNIPVTL